MLRWTPRDVRLAKPHGSPRCNQPTKPREQLPACSPRRGTVCAGRRSYRFGRSDAPCGPSEQIRTPAGALFHLGALAVCSPRNRGPVIQALVGSHPVRGLHVDAVSRGVLFAPLRIYRLRSRKNEDGLRIRSFSPGIVAAQRNLRFHSRITIRQSSPVKPQFPPNIHPLIGSHIKSSAPAASQIHELVESARSVVRTSGVRSN
jgi:hypothetical protein